MISYSGHLGELWTFAPGTVKQGLTFTTELALAFVLKSVFRQVRVSKCHFPSLHG